MRRSTRRAMAILVMMASSVMLAGGLASAHSQLVSSSPADGATLAEPPTSIVLTFNEALIPDVDSVSINDESGNVVASQSITPDGAELRVPWPSGLPAGTYQVAYRVVSGDGHPVVGAINFTIAGPGGAAPASVQPSPQPAAATVTEPGEAGALGGLAAAGLAAAALLAIAVGVVLVVRRRRE